MCLSENSWYHIPLTFPKYPMEMNSRRFIFLLSFHIFIILLFSTSPAGYISIWELPTQTKLLPSIRWRSFIMGRIIPGLHGPQLLPLPGGDIGFSFFPFVAHGERRSSPPTNKLLISIFRTDCRGEDCYLLWFRVHKKDYNFLYHCVCNNIFDIIVY